MLSPLVVTSGADSGPGSLRAAIAAAVDGDTITFANKVNKITLTTGELFINKNLDIEGPAATKLRISGNDAGRVFDISAGETVTLAGLTITDGLANDISPVSPGTGAGILNFGTLKLDNDVLSNNQAHGDPGGSPIDNSPGDAEGGGIANFGELTVTTCLFINNQALGASDISSGSIADQAGTSFGGGIYNSDDASVTGSLFDGNVAQGGSL